VCELCTSRAIAEGWLREGSVPTYQGRSSGAERRRSLLGRLRSSREERPETSEPAPEEPMAPARHAPEIPRRRPVAEPRHVRAVPTGAEQRMAAAVEAFNRSAHPRTLAGVSRSLGLPTVAVLPDETRPSLVTLTVSWELSWYRYEADLAEEEDGSVRVADQGSELEELSAPELRANATCDERGLLTLAA